MKRLRKWLLRSFLLIVILIACLAAPIVYVETACVGEETHRPYEALLSPEHHRNESRTLLTYPEWHIVHAYDDYAEVIGKGAPHDFGFLSSISGFWSSLCALTEKSSAIGEIDGPTKQMVYVIGTSFTVELAFKALYEETVGRLFVWLRGTEQSALDRLSARQAKSYAEFLQQVPWYKWDFRKANSELEAVHSGDLRDLERRFSLGIENSIKASYAGAIENAVASSGADQLTLRMIVRIENDYDFESQKGIRLIEKSEGMYIIQTPRYRALTHLMQGMAYDGVEFVEIAGNDQIMMTVLSDTPSRSDALSSMRRQGYGDYRHLILLNVSNLAGLLREFRTSGTRVEHIHDY